MRMTVDHPMNFYVCSLASTITLHHENVMHTLLDDRHYRYCPVRIDDSSTMCDD
jgi:hypothetical protein